MIVESSATILKSSIAKCLLECILGNLGGEEAALDLAELIALRMPTMTDDDLANLGFYIRANMVAMGRGHAPYCDVLRHLADAAVVAALGPAELKKSIEAGLDELLR